MRTRVSETFWAPLRTTAVPPGLADESSPPAMFWSVPPVHVVSRVVQFPPLPVTMNEPVVLVRKMPREPPFADTDWKVNVPAALFSDTAVPVVVVTVTAFCTVAPVIAPEFVTPVLDPVLRSRELTVSVFAASVRVELRVGLEPEAIVRGPSVNVVPWPQSVRPALLREAPA